jgi:hypothetical protein
MTMHLRQVAAALAGALVMAGALATDAAAQRRDRDGDRGRDRGWELLGEQSVGFRVDRDIIRINQSEDWYRTRRYRTLHFVAQGNDVHMMAIRLVYLNGFGEDFRIDRLIRDGGDLALDLRGERSFIRQIEMTYRSRPGFGGQAVIKVYGEPSRRGPPGPPPVAVGEGRGEWVQLGCKEVSFLGKDRDTLPVGREEGRFRAIRLQVHGSDVQLLSLVVVYGSGEPDRLPAQHFIRAGEHTPPIDLKGDARKIRQVDMVYKSIPSFRGQARVCVQGRQ